MIQDFLSNFPDVVFFQDSIEYSELTSVLEKVHVLAKRFPKRILFTQKRFSFQVSEGNYDYYFQLLSEDDERNDDGTGGAETRSVTGK